jgi:hypothetical protein
MSNKSITGMTLNVSEKDRKRRVRQAQYARDKRLKMIAQCRLELELLKNGIDSFTIDINIDSLKQIIFKQREYINKLEEINDKIYLKYIEERNKCDHTYTLEQEEPCISYDSLAKAYET